MKNKVFQSFAEAISDIPDGASIVMHHMVGPGGVAQNLILALRDRGVRNLTVISCNFGMASGTRIKVGFKSYVTPNLLVENHQVRKAVSCWAQRSLAYENRGERSALQDAIQLGEVEWEPSSMGIMVERIRAGGAGLGGFYSPVGVGTILEKGKEKKVINGRTYLLEMPIRADFAFVRAYKADTFGNLSYRGTSRSFNPLVATAGDITIVEVDEIVQPGELSPEHILTPGITVDRIVRIPEGGVR